MSASPSGPAPLAVETVLAPVDGSESSERSVEYAVAVAEKYGAAVHVVYVLDEDIVRGLETGALEESVVAADAEAFVETAESIAAAHDVPVCHSTAYGFSPTMKSRHPGSVILDCAEELAADFIVVPREPDTREPGEVLEKAAEYVLLYASQPVLSV